MANELIALTLTDDQAMVLVGFLVTSYSCDPEMMFKLSAIIQNLGGSQFLRDLAQHIDKAAASAQAMMS